MEPDHSHRCTAVLRDSKIKKIKENIGIFSFSKSGRRLLKVFVPLNSQSDILCGWERGVHQLPRDSTKLHLEKIYKKYHKILFMT